MHKFSEKYRDQYDMIANVIRNDGPQNRGQLVERITSISRGTIAKRVEEMAEAGELQKAGSAGDGFTYAMAMADQSAPVEKAVTFGQASGVSETLERVIALGQQRERVAAELADLDAKLAAIGDLV